MSKFPNFEISSTDFANEGPPDCHTGLSKESRLVLITSGKFIAKTVAKMDFKTNNFCWVGVNTVEIK